jgi:hypothetical protein
MASHSRLFYTVAEAIERTGGDPVKFWKLIQSNEIQRLQDKDEIFFRRSAIDKLQQEFNPNFGLEAPAAAAPAAAASTAPASEPTSTENSNGPAQVRARIKRALEESRSARRSSRVDFDSGVPQRGTAAGPQFDLRGRGNLELMGIDPDTGGSNNVPIVKFDPDTGLPVNELPEKFGQGTPSSVRRERGREGRLVSIGVNKETGERKYVELPEDYAARKRFRKLQQEELARPNKERKLAAGRKANRAKSLANLRNPLKAFKYSRRLMPGQSETPFMTGTKNVGKGLGAVAAGALIGGLIKMANDRRDAQERSDDELTKMARRDALGLMAQQDVKMSMQRSINSNLSQLQMEAPELYMRVAAGRLLPQGAVVIGGVPRQDLLQQLGMSMSNGDFNQ